MPCCCVANCRNCTEKGFRMFRLPRNEERKQKWLNLINQDNVSENGRVCEIHFSENQFEQNRADKRKLLCPNAIPNLLEISKKRKYSRLEDYESVIEESTVEKTEGTKDLNINNLKCDDIVSNSTLLEINKQVDNINTINELKQKLKAALKKCQQYKKRLEQKTCNLQKVFNADQLNYLERNTCRGSIWSDETMTKAFKLYMACGTKGYEEIRKQNLPYPSLRTLQHRL